MPSVSVVDGIGNGIQWEMIATKHPTPMFPSTNLRIEGLDPTAQYKMYLQLGKLVPQYEFFAGIGWKAKKFDDGYFHSSAIEVKRALSQEGQQSGEYFNTRGISFNNVKICFSQVTSKQRTDTLYVRRHFKYVQVLIVDRISPDNEAITVMRHSLFDNRFIAVSKLTNSLYCYLPANVLNMKTKNENIQRVHRRRGHSFVPPRVVERHFLPPLHPDPEHELANLEINDPGDYIPRVLPDGSVIVRTFGTTYFYPGQARPLPGDVTDLRDILEHA